MKKHFIPVNTIDKAIAFAPSLDSKYLERTQLIKQNDNYVSSINTIEHLNEKGWKLDAVCELRRKKSRTTEFNYIRMTHPDYKMSNNEGTGHLVIANSTTGKTAMCISSGMYRHVCENVLVSLGRRGNLFNIKHNEQGQKSLIIAVDNINEKVNIDIKKFETYKLKMLSKEEMQALAKEALKIRFDYKSDIDSNQLLNINRNADKGDNLWLVYNRIQENLTKSNMLVNAKGQLVEGINSVKNDLYVNNQLIELVEKYM